MDDVAEKRRKIIARAAGVVATMCAYTLFVFRRAGHKPPITYGPLCERDEIRMANLRFIFHNDDVPPAGTEDGNTSATPPPSWTPPNATGDINDKGKASSSGVGSKRKRLVSEDETSVFNGMTTAVQDLALAIKQTVHSEAHPDVYSAVMTLPGFNQDALLGALSYLYKNKAESLGFVQMTAEHRHGWMNHWIKEHYLKEN